MIVTMTRWFIRRGDDERQYRADDCYTGVRRAYYALYCGVFMIRARC